MMVVGTLAFASCGNSNTNKTENRVDSATTTMEQKADNAMSEVKDAVNGNQDSNFVVKAARTNMAEMKVFQAGIDNSSNKELKGHAKMMMADHKMIGETLMAYSSKKGYTLPASDEGKGDEIMGDLNKNTKGAEWDKAWVDHMVSAHKDVIDMFEGANKDVKDAELQKIITDVLPKLRSHLDMVKGMQDKMVK